ncbi:MAG TPA: tetratricopeptide repeat protein [Myxococcota bacterium]|nr:tetratricopeptide repeat protein [Myxococcota bacterium]
MLGALVCGCDASDPAPPPEAPGPAPEAAAEYVGAAACARCHPDETARWRGSDHDRAMEAPGPESVLGDFGGAMLDHFGERYSFERADEAYRIETGGVAYDVAWTFGFDPLQQYLVRDADGVLRAVGVAWDARPAGEGGQRWFHLHPEEPVPPGDVLHWQGPAGRWDRQCAACHSTGLVRRRAGDGFDTRFSEPDVACEACHGPGSRHVAWAEAGGSGPSQLVAGLAGEARWAFVEGEPIARRTGAPAAAQLDACAPCHARRASLGLDPDPGRRFLDGHRPALLDEGLYFADGQIRDEVYVWGSFVQSRMHAAGVVCGDCHDAHSLRIDEPDAVCASCHRPEVFGVREHHGHAPGSPGSSCVACHMPSRTYMGVDDRRDHGLRVPRPDLTEALRVPNPCQACHADRPPAWAAEALAAWHGPPPALEEDPAAVIDAGRRRLPGAGARLARLAEDRAQPAIRRATALRLLGAQLDARTAPVVRRALGAEEPLVRMAAVEAAEAIPADRRFALVAPRLADARRVVRLEAARVALSVAPEARGASPDLAAAVAELRAAHEARGDRPEAQVALGNLDLALGDPEGARLAYTTAVTRSPWFVPGWVNLADLERAAGDEAAAERALRSGLARSPESADLHHALGLLLVRTGRRDEALEQLAEAAARAPDDARYAWVYGVALISTGHADAALDALEAAHARHPGDPAIVEALFGLHRQRGDAEASARYREELRVLRGGAPH